MTTMTDKQIQTMFAALEARSNAQQAQLDAIDTRTAAIVENVNELRGDKQRVEARIAQQPAAPQFPAPVANGRRRAADQAARENGDARA